MKKIICAILCGIFISSSIGSTYVLAGENDNSLTNNTNSETAFLDENAEICAELYNPETKQKVEKTFDLNSAELVGFDDSGNPIIQSECEIETYLPISDNQNSDGLDEFMLPLSFQAINKYHTAANDMPKLEIRESNSDDTNYGFLACDTKTKTKTDRSGSVTAKLKITYTASDSNGYYANLTKVSGSWSNQDRSVKISSRKVVIGRSTGSKKVTYNPSSDSFSYNVKWGGAKWMAGASTFGATSTATLNRGIGGNPWYLTLQCVISEDDF